MDLDDETAVVSHLNGDTSMSSRVHDFEKGASGWSLTQTIAGGQGIIPLYHGRRAGAASVFDIPSDGDANGIEDPCDILAGAADLDGDGVLDEIEAVMGP